MAPPARLELTTLRLGGARSIQVSYGGVTMLLYPKIFWMSILSEDFFPVWHIYWKECLWKGGLDMWNEGAENQDLDDLIFEEDDGGPSER